MKILIIEDDDNKRDEICDFIVSLGVPTEHILTAKDMAEFMIKFGPDVSLCIIDLRLPAYEGAGQENNGIGVLQAIDRAGANHARMLAISAYLRSSRISGRSSKAAGACWSISISRMFGRASSSKPSCSSTPSKRWTS